jgi:hypothetical protein
VIVVVTMDPVRRKEQGRLDDPQPVWTNPWTNSDDHGGGGSRLQALEPGASFQRSFRIAR